MANEHFWSCFGVPKGVKMSKTVEKLLQSVDQCEYAGSIGEEDLRFVNCASSPCQGPQFIYISFMVFSGQFYGHQLMEFSWLKFSQPFSASESPLTLGALFLLSLRLFHIQQLLFNCLLPEFRPEIPPSLSPFQVLSPFVYSLLCLKLCKIRAFPYISISFLLQHIGSGIFCHVTLSFLPI